MFKLFNPKYFYRVLCFMENIIKEKNYADFKKITKKNKRLDILKHSFKNHFNKMTILIILSIK